MVRVLNVINLDCGGAETTVMNFYRNIDRSKVQFDFLIVNGPENYYEAEAVSLGARIFRRPMRTKHPIKNALALYKILTKNRDMKIIHVHNSLPYVAVDMIVAMLFGVHVRVAHSRSAIPNPSLAHRVCRPLLRAVSTNWFGCSTEAGMSMFSEGAVKNAKFTLIPNARDLSRLHYDLKKRVETRKKLSVNNSLTLLHVARLNPVKNQFFLLEVLAYALKTDAGIVLLVAGEGELKDKLEAKASELGLGGSIQFLGFRDDIPDLLQAADLFVLPSFHEGLPGVAIEAQAAGLPCLLSDAISRETDVSGLVKFLPIDKGPEIWADEIMSFRDFPREDKLEAVRAGGYDIKEAARKLTEFYISAVKD